MIQPERCPEAFGLKTSLRMQIRRGRLMCNQREDHAAELEKREPDELSQAIPVEEFSEQHIHGPNEDNRIR